MPPEETKTIKVYRRNDESLERLRERLTRLRGRQATYADVVDFLIGQFRLMSGEA